MQAALQHILLFVLFRHGILLKSEAPSEVECLPRTTAYSNKNLKVFCSRENARAIYHYKETNAARESTKKEVLHDASPYDVLFSFQNQAQNGAVNLSCVITHSGSQLYLIIETGNHSELSNEHDVSVRASTSPNTFGTLCNSDPETLNGKDWSEVKPEGNFRILRESSWKCRIKHWTLNIAIRDEASKTCDLEMGSGKTKRQGKASLNSTGSYRNDSTLGTYDVERLHSGCNGTHNVSCQRSDQHISGGSQYFWKIASRLHHSKGMQQLRVKRKTNDAVLLDNDSIVRTPAHFRVINKSEPELHCYRGGVVEITLVANVAPVQTYNSSWFKLSSSMPNGKWEPVSSLFISRRIVGNIITERLHLTHCNWRTTADYALKVSLGSAFEQTLRWKVMYIAAETDVTIGITSDPYVEKPFMLWRGNGSAWCYLLDGIIEDLTMQTRPYGIGSWRDIDPKQLVVDKSGRMSTLKWKFVVEKDIEIRCINKTSGQNWGTFANVTAIKEPIIEKTEERNRTLLTCYVPMKYINAAMWVKDNEILGYENPVVENYVGKLTVDTSTAPSPWGVFECHVGDSILIYQNLPPAKTKKLYIIVFVGASFAAALALLGWLSFVIRQKRRHLRDTEWLKKLLKQLTEQPDKEDELTDKTLPLHERLDELTYNDRYEIRREKLFFYKKQLGHGQFGSVWKCRVIREQDTDTALDYIDAAAKMPRDKHNAMQYEVLLDELRMMIAVGIHPNLLCLVGATVQDMTNPHDKNHVRNADTVDIFRRNKNGDILYTITPRT